jgi:hypothetical protein
VSDRAAIILAAAIVVAALLYAVVHLHAAVPPGAVYSTVTGKVVNQGE